MRAVRKGKAMKKLLVCIAGALLALSIAGCGSGTQASSSSSSQGSSAAGSSESTAIANPWKDAATAQEAGEGAGLEGFSTMDKVNVAGDTMSVKSYTYTDGIAQALYEQDDKQLTVRKGKGMNTTELAGDYNTYASTWTQNVKGLNVTCMGAEEGKAQHVEWTLDDDVYAILCSAPDGKDFSLDEGDIQSLVMGIQ